MNASRLQVIEPSSERKRPKCGIVKAVRAARMVTMTRRRHFSYRFRKGTTVIFKLPAEDRRRLLRRRGRDGISGEAAVAVVGPAVPVPSIGRPTTVATPMSGAGRSAPSLLGSAPTTMREDVLGGLVAGESLLDLPSPSGAVSCARKAGAEVEGSPVATMPDVAATPCAVVPGSAAGTFALTLFLLAARRFSLSLSSLSLSSSSSSSMAKVSGSTSLRCRSCSTSPPASSLKYSCSSSSSKSLIASSSSAIASSFVDST
mmetsp:Transcript_19717/g.49517  ORF Transcript_19717/g.49517 Transcript_19717/m.49517 type:complete len:259 (-) Transcript_19717:3440-4216(-)